MAQTKRKKARRTPTKGGTRVIGGYYQLPKTKGKGRTKLHRYGYGKSSKGFNYTAYHNEHYMRTGKFGDPKKAQLYSGRLKKSRRAAYGSGAALGAAYALGSKHNSSKAHYAALATAIGASGYSMHKSGQANRQLNKDTSTKRSALVGYYYRKGRGGKKIRVKKGKRAKRK